MRNGEKQSGHVIFASLPSGIFGNGGQSWIGIDLTPARIAVENLGFEVIELPIDKLFHADLSADDIVIYCSCDEPEILGYLKDVFYFIKDRCRVVPQYDLLLAHENKGFQELHKTSLGIGHLNGDYHYDLRDLPDQLPVVFKTIDGAGSSGVRLIKNEQDQQKIRRTYFDVGLKRRIIRFQRKLKLTAQHYAAYHYRHKGFRRHVLQDFVPDMSFDYKVLVFGERYFVLKRFVRDGDFRASGSGKFDFEADIPAAVLGFASDIADRLQAPQLSLDILQSARGCHLVEYQALNFGPITLKRSKGFYRQCDDGWEWVPGASDLDECFAHAVDTFLRRTLATDTA